MGAASRETRHPALVGLVEKLWWTPAHAAAPPKTERVLPTAQAQIIVSTRANGGLFVGPKTQSAEIVRHHDRSMVGASLRAGASAFFVGAPTGQTLDQTIELDSIWVTGSLVEELAELAAEPALARLEAELVRRVRRDVVDNRVLRAEHAIRSGVPAGRVGEWLGEDRRTLVPDFRRAVGVGIKHYERIRRFSRCIAQIRRPNPASLASIAAELGYSDQAHLTREVQHFGGLTPTVVWGDGTSTPNHVAVATRSSRR